MILLSIVLLCASLYSLVRAVALQQAAKPVRYRTGYLTLRIDHMRVYHNETFELRYLYNYDWYRRGGPIFFYCGGQEPVEAAAARIVGGALSVINVSQYVNSENTGRPGGGIPRGAGVRRAPLLRRVPSFRQ
jgi:Serine carboxypeptidase S28